MSRTATWGRPTLALRSIERYVALGGEAARKDEPIQRMLFELRRRQPGGKIAQRDVHQTLAGGR